MRMLDYIFVKNKYILYYLYCHITYVKSNNNYYNNNNNHNNNNDDNNNNNDDHNK